MVSYFPSVAAFPAPSSSLVSRDPGYQLFPAPFHGAYASYFTQNLGQVKNADIQYYSSGPVDIGFAQGTVLLKLKRPVTPAPPFEDPGRRGASPAPTVEYDPSGVLVRITFDGANPVFPQARGELPFRSNFFLGNDPSEWRTGVRGYREVVYPNLYDGIDLVYRTSDRGLKYEFVVGPGADWTRIALVLDGVRDVSVDASGDLIVATAVGDLRDSGLIGRQDDRAIPCSFFKHSRGIGFRCAGVEQSRGFVIDPLIYSTYLGGTQLDEALALAVDSAGDAFVVGLSSSVDFPTTAGAYDGSYNGSGSDIVVAKLNPLGSALLYSTYLGGSRPDAAYAIAVDALGNAYLGGYTDSDDFPVTLGAYDTSMSGTDAVLVKLDPAGSTLLYSTFLGGFSTEEVRSVAVDTTGAVYAAGITFSPDFPTSLNALDRTCGSDGACDGGAPDAFLTRLNATGDSVDASTFLGGSGDDRGWGVALDPLGYVFLTGSTSSSDFPTTPGAFQRSDPGGSSAFLTRLSPDGSALVASTLLGGSDSERGQQVAIDGGGNAYVAGFTVSPDFPATPGAFDTRCGSDGRCDVGAPDAFIASFNGSAGLRYATFIGGSAFDFGWSIAVDRSGRAVIAGETLSPDFPTTVGAVSRTFQVEDVFLASLDPSGTRLEYGTFLGGRYVDDDGVVALDGSGAAYVVGTTSSPDFPVTPTALDRTPNGGLDLFVAKIGLSAGLPNDPPSLAWTGEANFAMDGLDPESGTTATPFSYRIAYRDSNNDPPTAITVTIERPLGTIWNTLDLSFDSWQGSPFDYTAGATYNVSTLLAPAGTDYWYSFNATDGVAWATGPPTIPVDSPDVLNPPDYVPANPFPSAPVVVGLSIPVTLSIEVRNIGDSLANATTTLAFYNASMPSAPFSRVSLPPILADEATGPFVASWTSPSTPGTFTVTVVADLENSVAEANETNNAYTWTIIVVPGPITILVLGAPNVSAASTYVTSSTPLSFHISDPGGTGIRRTIYRTSLGPWTNFTSSGPFALAGEGPQVLEWHSEDVAGNVEATRTATLVVDDTPPTTEIALTAGSSMRETRFSLTATDTASGVERTEYRIDGGPWVPYTGPVALPEGNHVIGFHSVDRLGNTEPVHTRPVTISSTTVSPAELNWKPLVALVFVVILSLAGERSSRRAPWKGIEGRKGALTAFALTALPFVLLEGATGVVSLVTGFLSIPPVFGIGTAVDSAILVAGLAVAVYRRAGARPRVQGFTDR